MRDFLQEISQAAGQISLDYRQRLSPLDFDRKSPKDIVTEADVAVEDYLMKRIRTQYPSHGIFGEESGQHDGETYRWIIDPIDGTTSFLHNQPFFSVSIAVEKDGEIIMGAVNAPAFNECYFAERGQGATCNDQPIAVSQANKLIDSVLGTGFVCVRNDLARNNLPYFNEIVGRIRGIRRYGSVAIDLCYVACGRLDGFWEMGLHLYDIAAGGLILQEAGGQFTDFHGQSDGIPGEVLGTNGQVHEELSGILLEVDRRADHGPQITDHS